MDSQLNEEGASSPPRADPYSSHSEESDDEPSAVVTLTNSNFQDAVYGPDTDVLLEFYAPWWVLLVDLSTCLSVYLSIRSLYSFSPS